MQFDDFKLRNKDNIYDKGHLLYYISTLYIFVMFYIIFIWIYNEMAWYTHTGVAFSVYVFNMYIYDIL